MTHSTQIKSIPARPGVYLFKDSQDNILYVGKARFLRSRVQSYFRKNANLDAYKQQMIRKIADIATIGTDTENEALILEANLIRQHQPPYNIILRDDKFYLFIKITTNEEIPRVFPVRQIKKDGARYFGPYSSAASVRNTLKLLRRIFPHRDEKENPRDYIFPHPLFNKTDSWSGHPDKASTKSTPTERLPAEARRAKVGATGVVYTPVQPKTGQPRARDKSIVVNHCTYHQNIQHIIHFLEGDKKSITSTLKTGMQKASRTEQFERAAIFRDQLRAIERLEGSQKVYLPGQENFDVISIARDKNMSAANLFQVRQGKLLGKNTFLLKHRGAASPQDILRQFILQYYSVAQDIPKQILVPHHLSDQDTISKWINTEQPPVLHTPQRGKKKQLLNMGTINAQQLLNQEVTVFASKNRLYQALSSLASSLNIKMPLHRIETYDISNIQGKLATGSLVVFTEGQPDKSQYKKFRIKVGDTPNDYAMLQETLYRRFSNRHPNWPEPDLILIDGGRGQLGAAHTTLSQLGVDIPIAAIAKREELLFTFTRSLNPCTTSDCSQTSYTQPNPQLHRPRRTAKANIAEAKKEIILPPGRKAPTEQATGVADTSKQHSAKKVRLPYDSTALFLVQRMRDEAHRFTLSYHQLLRSKQQKKSILDEIPGIGPKTKKKILNHFGSLKAIRTSPEEELVKILGPAKTKTLRDWL